MNQTNIIQLTPAAPVVPPPRNRQRLKTVAKHASRIARTSNVWTKVDVGALTKLLNGIRWEKDDAVRSAISDLQYAAVSELNHKITVEQTKLGIEWLRANFIGKRGQAKACLRKAIDRPESNLQSIGFISEAVDAILHITKSFSKFRFVGVYVDRNNYGCEWHYPIYRTYARDGSFFDYTPLHWAAPIIHRIHLAKG